MAIDTREITSVIILSISYCLWHIRLYKIHSRCIYSRGRPKVSYPKSGRRSKLVVTYYRSRCRSPEFEVRSRSYCLKPKLLFEAKATVWSWRYCLLQPNSVISHVCVGGSYHQLQPNSVIWSICFGGSYHQLQPILPLLPECAMKKSISFSTGYCLEVF